MGLIEWPERLMEPLAAIRLLQHAANMLNVTQFCAAQGWEVNDYSRAKFREFQALGRLHVFGDSTLLAAMRKYEELSDAQR
jgi:hypothetical protein